MDSAANRALAGLLIHVDRGMRAIGAACSDTHFHLTVPLRPFLAGLFMLSAVFLDFESIILVVVSMGVMLFNFVQRFPFTKKAKHEVEQDCSTSRMHLPELPRKPNVVKSEWNIDLDPETASSDAALADLCETVFGLAASTSRNVPTCKLIALGPALMEPAPKLGRVLGAMARIAAEAIPGAKIYGFERTSASPGYPGGSMEVAVVVPCQSLIEQLGDRLQRGIRSGHLMLTTAQLHKSALRYLIDQLVTEGFKFRCSAFKAHEPAVALSAPLGLSGGHATYVSLSVNNPLPFLEAVLTHHASVSDARAVPLIAAVQRWAELRGLTHPVFGPLTMYGWAHTCLFFLIHHAQPRMPHLVMEPKRKGFLEPGKGHRPVDPKLLEKFFDFCASFPYGRNHMWLVENVGPCSPFIQDALRPGIDLGYHLQHKLPRKQLQAEAALAASALRNPDATVDALSELGPVKIKDKGARTQTQPSEALDDLRIMKKTRIPGLQPKAKEVKDSTAMSQEQPKDAEEIELGTEVPLRLNPPDARQVPPWKVPPEQKIPPWRRCPSSPSTRPPSEVDATANDSGCSSREMSE